MAISVLPFSTSLRAQEPAPAAASSAQRSFPILEYRIEGNTLLPRIDIERAVTPYLGPDRSIKDVEAARQGLEKRYHDRGYQTVLVNIPQQEISAGIVRLTVIEAPVGRLEVKGSRFHSLQVIRLTIPELAPGVTPDFRLAQQQLADLNRSQDLHVTPVLRASMTPGQVDVDLDVQDQLPLHESLEVNNRYSPNTAHLRVIGELSYDNLFQRNQSASIQYQIAPEDPPNAEIWSVSYVIPTGGGPVLALYVLHSDSNIAAVGDLNVIGNGRIYGARFIAPLASASANFFHNVTVGFDYKDFRQNVTLQGSDVAASPAAYPPFSLQYTATWLGVQDTAQHAAAATTGARSSTTLDAGLSFLVRGFFTNAAQFSTKRAGAGPSFAILRPALQRQQLLIDDWSLVTKLEGQLASGPLISNEQYGAGGVDSVRGYAESERLGDDGVRESIELRTPQLLARRAPHFEQSYLYAFADAAQLTITDPLPGQISTYHLDSVGIGLRLKLGGLSVDLDGARAGTAGYITRAGSYSAQFRINYSH